MIDNALILVAEDEGKIAEVLVAYLEREGFRTVRASDGQVALDHHRMLRPDLVLLDIKLPKVDGLTVLSDIRSTSDTPVIMVTAMKEDLDKLLALRVGADDYVVKPFNPLEVVARVRTVLRRTQGQRQASILRIGALEIDRVAHLAEVVQGERRVALNLTATEFRILGCMAANPRKAFTRGEIIDACLPEREAMERTVDSHVSNLRRKIAEAGGGEMLGGVRGVGYRLTAMP